MRLKTDQIIHTFNYHGFPLGAAVQVRGVRGDSRMGRVVFMHPGQKVAIRICSPLERLWYVLTHPRHWKRALDIPFTPSDILVRS